MYSYIYSLLAPGVSKDTCIYFCMESEEMWEEVFGYTPGTKGGLTKMLDNAAIAAIAKF